MSNKLQMRSYASALALCAWTAPAAHGAEDMALQTQSVRETSPETRAFDIPAQPLSDALIEFSAQSGQTVIADPGATAGLRSTALKGDYPSADALARLLGESRLNIVRRGEAGFLVRPTQTARLITVSGNQRSASLQQTPPRNENDAGDDARNDVQPSRSGRADQRATTGRDELVVTGTNIRGIAPDSSPVRSFSREEIDRSGAATIQDFVQKLPQNFSGGSNANIVGTLPNDFSAGANAGREGTFGSSVNLRGLGSGSTLVLLDGHRIAPSSGIGDFVDISLIPGSAIERIEMLTDGASSIYGGDAVAGVVNLILRDNFDGVESSIRYGTVSEGQLDEFRAGLTLGETWNSGNALIAYEFYDKDNLSAGDRQFSQDAILPTDLLPSQRRHSVLASAAQSLTPRIEIDADFLYARRRAGTNFMDSGFFVRSLPVTSTLAASSGARWSVSPLWDVEVSGAHSRTDSTVRVEGDLPRETELDSSLWTADAKASGTLFTLPGGDLKLALGSHHRRESFSNVRIDTDIVQRDADRDVSAVFGELFLPIFGETNSAPGFHRLELNASGRYERYSDFGSQTTPKVGILWAPVDSLQFRGSYGRSFKPPPLGRVGALDYTAFVALTSGINASFALTPADPSIADVTAIYVSGTDNDLRAERSRTYTAGVDFQHTVSRHSFAFKGTYFDVAFEDRLGNTPIPGNRSVFDAPNIAFLDPDAFPAGTVVFSPSQSAINALLQSVDTIRLRGDVDPLDAEIISTAQLTKNLAFTHVRGIDAEADYLFASSFGDLSVGASASYLRDFQQRGGPASPLVDRIDTLYNPVSLRLRGHVGYSIGGLDARLFVNHANSYRLDDSADAPEIDSWNTIDLSLAYDLGGSNPTGLLSKTVLRLAVSNLFDTNPPSTFGVAGFGIFGYDPTNASPLNRFVAFELSKRF